MKKTMFSGALLLLLFLAACTADETAVSNPDNGNPADNGNDEVDNDEVTTSSTSDTAQTSERFPAERYADYEIVTLLPRDGIPAIDNPQFVSASEADGAYDPDELILGVEFNGDARAYSVPLLSRHEIVNDTVGGVKLAVTW